MKIVTEEQLLKALGELETEALEASEEVAEEPVAKGGKNKMAKKAAPAKDEESSEDESSEESEDAAKSHTEEAPGMPDDTEEANGGLAHLADPNEDEEHFDVDAEDNDPTGASMKSLVAGSDTLKKAHEVSAFLEALTDANVQSVDGLRKSLNELLVEQRSFNAKLQKAMIALGTVVLEMKKSQVDESEEPVVVRPRSVLAKSAVTERFGGGEGAQTQKSYTREQTLEALTQLAEAGKVPAIAVSAYESSDFVEPSLVGLVTSKLSQMFR